MYVCIYTWIDIHTHICLCVCVCVHICACVLRISFNCSNSHYLIIESDKKSVVPQIITISVHYFIHVLDCSAVRCLEKIISQNKLWYITLPRIFNIAKHI